MKAFEFTIVASGLDHEADDFEDRFFEAGCDDATIAVARGAIILQFSRQSPSLENAIASAIDGVRRAGATVDRVEPDYLVSLSEIAERAGLTRAALTNYAKGERGEAFPHPVARVTTTSPLWDWTDVAGWLHSRGQIDSTMVGEAVVIKTANGKLEDAAKRLQIRSSGSDSSIDGHRVMSKEAKNSGKASSASNVSQVGKLVSANTPTRFIGLKLGRSEDAVYSKASAKGISQSPTHKSPYKRKK